MIVATVVLAAVFAQEPLRLQPDLGARERERQAEQHYRAGVDALRSERFDEAVQELRQAVRLEPDFFLAYFTMGKTYIALKQYDDSVRAYLACREAWERAAAEAMKEGFDKESRVDDRIREYRDQIRELRGQLSTARSDDERSRIERGIESIKVAVDSLDRIRYRNRGALEPPAEFPFALGSAYLRTGQVDEAERAYLEALKLRPKYGEAHSNLAVIYLKRSDFDQAQTHVKAAQKAGFSVHPQLAKAIEDGRKASRK